MAAYEAFARFLLPASILMRKAIDGWVEPLLRQSHRPALKSKSRTAFEREVLVGAHLPLPEPGPEELAEAERQEALRLIWAELPLELPTCPLPDETQMTTLLGIMRSGPPTELDYVAREVALAVWDKSVQIDLACQWLADVYEQRDKASLLERLGPLLERALRWARRDVSFEAFACLSY